MIVTDSDVVDAVRAAMDDPQLRTLLCMDNALRKGNDRRYVGYVVGDGHCYLKFRTSAGERHVHIGASGDLAGNVTVEDLQREH